MVKLKFRCDKCGKTTDVRMSAIIGDTYYKILCNECGNESLYVSSGGAQWQRTLDAEDNEAALQQPWNSDGSINTRFAKLYPRQAQAIFTSEELDKANRK